MTTGLDRRRVDGQRIDGRRTVGRGSERRWTLGLTLLLSALLVPLVAGSLRADELDDLFDQLVASADSDAKRIENAKLLMEKAEEFPDRRKGIEARALKLAREAEQPESLPIIEGIYRYWLEQPGTPNEKIYAVLIKDFRDAIGWKMPDGEKLTAARKALSFYDASSKYLIERDRYTEAAQVMEQQKDFVRKYRKAVDPNRDRYKALDDRIDELEDLAEKKADRKTILAEATANPEDATLNAKAGIALFNEDKLAQALPFLTRGGQRAAPYREIVQWLRPLYEKRNEFGLSAPLIEEYAAAVQAGDKGKMEPLAEQIAADPELQEPAMRVKVFIMQDEPLEGLEQELLTQARARLEATAQAPAPLDLFNAAQAYVELAKQDKHYGEKRMADESRFYLWKGIALHEQFRAANPEGENKQQASISSILADMLTGKLADAGGYTPAGSVKVMAGWQPRLEIDLADVGRIVKQAKRTLGQAVVYEKWPFDAEEARERQVETAKRLGLPVELVVRLPESEATVTLVLIPAGAFAMGTPEEEVKKLMEKHAGDKWFVERAPGEYPRHGVRITRPFYLGRTEVTQAQWEAVTGNNPSKNQGGGALPVEQVSWNEVTGDFLAKANAAAKLEGEAVFALPTEAQWEYTCRAGTATEYHAGDGEDALKACGWYRGNSDGKTHAAGEKEANAWTLHDMHGNVWEWCRDNYDRDWYRKEPPTDDPENPGQGNTPRVLRGGGWYNPPDGCRSAFRTHRTPDDRTHSIGWRLSLDLH